MAPKKLIFTKQGEEEKQPNLDEENEETQCDSDSDSTSETDSSKNQEHEAVPPPVPLKPSSYSPRREEAPAPESEPNSESEDGSDCSSPSASGFIIMPSVKPVEKKKPSASKKFSEEDEITLLRGLSEFWAKGKNNKWTEFHQFIKDDLPHQFTKIQVSEKIRGLKKKFDANLVKFRAKGGKLDFSDPHESVLFDLSNLLWGDEDHSTGEEKRTTPHPMARKRAGKECDEEEKRTKRPGTEEKKKKKMRAVEIEEKDFKSKYPLLWASLREFPSLAREHAHLIGREKARELEERWRELMEDEIRLKLKRMELMKRDLEHELGRN